MKSIIFSDLTEKFFRAMKDYETYWIGASFFVSIDNPEDVKTVLNSNAAFEKGFFYSLLFNYGLIVETKEHYKTHKKLLNPLFTPSALQSYIPKINESMDGILKNNQLDGLAHDVVDMSFAYACRGVLETLFNDTFKLGSDDKVLNRLRVRADRFVETAFIRIFKPWLIPSFMFKRSKYGKEWEHLLKVIFEEDLNVKYEDIYKKKIDPDNMSFFDCMSQWDIPFEKFREIAISFVGASVDTTSSTLVDTLILLAIHTDVQEKLYNEVSSVLSSSNDLVTEIEMAQMPFLEQCIKESLRVLPIGPNLFRVTSAPLKLKKFTVPAGTNLHIRVEDIHKDERFWGADSKVFNPDRFEPERMKDIHSHAYVPFSSGSRMCPGYKYAYLSMKVFLSRMIMEYKMTTELKYEDISYDQSLIMKIKNEAIINFKKRNM